MRLLLVLAAAVALALLLIFALSGGPAAPAIEPEPVGPETRAAHGDPASRVELEVADTRSSAALDTAPSRVATAPVSAARAVVAIVVTGGDAQSRSWVSVECRDALARPVVLAGETGSIWRARDVAPGDHVVSVISAGCLPVVEHVEVRPLAAEQRFEIRIGRAPRVRVRWQAVDGSPFLDAMRAPGVLAAPVVVRVSVDSRAREFGDAAVNARTMFGFAVVPDGGSAARELGPPWAGAPPDAVCEIAVATPLPVSIRGAIDSTILASAPVDATTGEIVFRTHVDLVRSLRATVRFCLADAETGAPIVGAEFLAEGGSGIERAVVDVPNTCHVDTRLTAGRWHLTWHAAGRAPLRRDVELAPLADLDLGELRLEAPATVTARVVRADGGFERGVRVLLYADERFERGELGEALTDDRGVAAFGGLASEELVVAIADPRYAARTARVRANAASGPARVELRLEPGVEVALDCGPTTGSSARVYVRDAAGAPVACAWIPTAGVVPLRLMPGKYVAEVEGASGARAFEVTDESTVYDLR